MLLSVCDRKMCFATDATAIPMLVFGTLENADPYMFVPLWPMFSPWASLVVSADILLSVMYATKPQFPDISLAVLLSRKSYSLCLS